MLIYCIEDDTSIRELILCALKTGGMTGVGFESSTPFWRSLDEKTPNLILLDIMLPEESGIDILNELKNSKYSNIPVILVTAKANEVDKVRGLDLGADDYIIKPFGVMEMLSRIKAVLRRSEKATSNILEEYGIKIDLDGRTVSSNKNMIILTHKEFELLYILMKNRNKVLNREQLLLEIWGYNFMGESRTLDVHIRTLRQKIAEYSDSAVITTVRNVGYKFEKNNI